MTRVGTALAAAVALLSVSACTGEEPAGGDPTTSAPSPPATSSPTPTPAAPTIPPEATEHSADGAAAFVKYWNQVFNYAVPSQDTKQLSEISAPDCSACNAMIRFIDGIREGGGSSQSPDYRTTVTSTRVVNGTFMVAARHESSSYRFRESSTSDESLVRAATYRYIYELTWLGNRWLVEAIRKQERP
jgi:ketosteroid isomerase-like protein